MKKKLPVTCPSCTAELSVRSLACDSCETVVSGNFVLPLVLSRLSDEEQLFVIDFVKCSGSLKIMAEQLGLSYPSVRNRLDDIIEKISTHPKPRSK